MDTSSQMPMATSTNLPLDPGLIMAEMGPRATPAPPTPQAMGAMQTQNAPAGAPPPPPAPRNPPFDVTTQPDGSIISVISRGLPPGMPPIVIGVHKAPKIPPALQHLTQ